MSTRISVQVPDPGDARPRFDRETGDEWLAALGLKRLSPAWAKAEIVVGLAVATYGLKLLSGEGMPVWGGAALVVLGLYLAMAGHRSHLYQAMNRQNALLARMIRDSSTNHPDIR